MTYRTWQKRKTLNLHILQPQLPVCGAEIDALLHQILAAHFPENPATPAVFFGRTPTLAYIQNARSGSGAEIWMHHALNDPGTPDYVFSHVLKHELLHTRIRPREVDGKWSAHPPDFWEEEKRIAGSDRIRAWEWIYGNFTRALKRDAECECIWVNNRMMKELLHNRYFAEQDIKHIQAASTLARRELRFGFRQEALRAVEPKIG